MAAQDRARALKMGLQEQGVTARDVAYTEGAVALIILTTLPEWHSVLVTETVIRWGDNLRLGTDDMVTAIANLAEFARKGLRSCEQCATPFLPRDRDETFCKVDHAVAWIEEHS